jgi:arsenate reductase
MANQLFPAKFTLLHNPRCSKSRAAKALLEERGITYQERLYLDDPLSAAELTELARRLGFPASEWVRRNESAYKDLTADAKDNGILTAMAEHPILIERPILISATRAVVGRPPERILELLR